MKKKIIVFDLDGTLIDSQKMKLYSFYDIFDQDYSLKKIVADVLDENPEESRFTIIKNILRRLENDEDTIQKNLEKLAEKYNSIVLHGAKTCNELPGASQLLEDASKRHTLFLSSNTPIEPLKQIVAYRGWNKYFNEIYGYPAKKDKTLQYIIKTEMLKPTQVIVVGDGKSDEQSASFMGCYYYKITSKYDLLKFKEVLFKGWF